MATNFDEIRSPFEGERTFPDPDTESDATLPSRLERRDDEYYSVLNVARGADDQELKRAYNQMCLRYHPDRYTDLGEKETAQELFQKVQEAYEVLRDPAKRAAYDLHGRKGLGSKWATTIAIRDPKLYEHEVFVRLLEEIDELQSYTPTGAFAARFDLSKIDQIHTRDGIDLNRIGRYIQTKDISIQEKISTQIGASTSLNLGGAVSLNEKSGHVGQFFVGLSHTLSNGLFTKVTGSIGNWPALRIQIRKQLLDRIQFNFIGMARFAGSYFMCVGVPSITTRLGSKTNMNLQLEIGRTSLKFLPVISHQVTTKFHISAKFGVNPANPSVKLECVYVPIEDYLINFGVKFSYNSQKLKYALQKSFSDQTSLSVGFSFENPGGVEVVFSLKRYAHTFSLPIRFSERITVQRSIYVHLLPIAIYGLTYTLYYSPFFSWARIKLSENEVRVKEEQFEKERKRQVEVVLMTEAYQRSIAVENQRNGLVIREAWFGMLRSRSGVADKLISEGLPCVLDVTVPLQCLVKESKLVLTDASKVHLAGFYDVYKGERKDLNVKYYFQGKLHEVTVEDHQPLFIPKRSHQLRP